MNSLNRDIKKVLLDLGKAQIGAMFSRQEFHTLDDSEFIPLLEVVMDEFASSALAPEEVDGLWDHAYKTYDRLCREADPSYSFEENRDLMRSFLIGSRGMNKDKR